jgi:hypothetical protein
MPHDDTDYNRFVNQNLAIDGRTDWQQTVSSSTLALALAPTRASTGEITNKTNIRAILR